MTDLKQPSIIVGKAPVGNYVHAVLKELGDNDFVYVYAFEGTIKIVEEIKALLYPLGVEEIDKRKFVYIPNKHDPNKTIRRNEIKLEVHDSVINILKELQYREASKKKSIEPEVYEDYGAAKKFFSKILKK